MVVYTGLPEWDEMNFLLRILRPRMLHGHRCQCRILHGPGLHDCEGPLLAFEANPRNLEVLREQVKLNQLANAEVFGTALGNSTGELSFLDSGVRPVDRE